MTTENKADIYGIAATFHTTPDIYHACEKVRDAGFKRWDSYSPFPIHGIHHAMGLPRSRVPAFTLLGGVTGFLTGLFIVAYMNLDYPLDRRGETLLQPGFSVPDLLRADDSAGRIRNLGRHVHCQPTAPAPSPALSITNPSSALPTTPS